MGWQDIAVLDEQRSNSRRALPILRRIWGPIEKRGRNHGRCESETLIFAVFVDRSGLLILDLAIGRMGRQVDVISSVESRERRHGLVIVTESAITINQRQLLDGFGDLSHRWEGVTSPVPPPASSAGVKEMAEIWLRRDGGVGGRHGGKVRDIAEIGL